MSDSNVIDVSKLIDDQPIRPFHVKLVILLFLFMIADGYDLQGIGFAAPGIVKMLHIDRSALGPVFSASLVGMLFGAPLFGWIGDRFGRRPALLWGAAIFGVVSLLTAFAQDLPQLLVLRFVCGIGLGGVPANSVALVAEYAPKRMRATMIVMAQIGLTFGSMLPAVASGLMEGAHGWRPLFIVGGIAPLLIGVAGFFLLPESLKFMVVKKRAISKIWRVASALDPRLQVNSGSTFVVPGTQLGGAQRFHIKQLFGDGLMWITPILWLLYMTFLSANYFLHGWMPILFRDDGLTITQTAVAAAMFDVGGILGALVSSRLVDKYGVATVVVLYVVACPAVAVIGLIGHSLFLLGASIFVAGFCLVGITLSMGAVAGVIYPTEVRANGIGWCYGVGRFASILSPVIGGWLIGMKLPISQLFLVPVVPMLIGAAACFTLLQLCLRRFDGISLNRKAEPMSEPVLEAT
jgi:AAHS family 4-hydroxybenzoate transporter-like MFS transporter